MPEGRNNMGQPIKIARADIHDLERLCDLENKTFNYDVISKRQMRYLLSSFSALVYKAMEEESLVGSMILLTRKKSRSLRLYSLAVEDSHRSQGIGKMMLNFAEKAALSWGGDAIRLEQRVDNLPLLLFYLAAGYKLYGRKEEYYSDGKAALLLEKFVGGNC